jgi:Tol biopolymer transport system component
MTAHIVRYSVLIAATALALTSPTGAQSGHELFQQALSKERAEGKLQEAIALYQRVVDVASADHALAARALLQLGRCYEQLGNTEARTAYERLIARYPDQTDLVAQAKTRLTALGRTPSSASPAAMTVVPLPDVGNRTLAVTRDGTKAIAFDFSTGQNLALHDFSRKQMRLLTDLDWNKGLINFAVWSPDAQRVAYQQNNYSVDKDPVSELRVTTLDGRSSVVHRIDVYGGVRPVGWTPEGTTLIAVVGRPDKTWAVGTLPAAGGPFTPLRSFGWSNPDPRLSPDGRFIAYHDGDQGTRDLQVVSVDGRQAYRITHDPADDFAPIWSPDSRHLVFKSNRLGSVSMWTVEVKDGQPAGQPVKLKDGMQSAQLIDWTERGIVYVESWRTSDLYTVPMDPIEGRQTGSPQPISYWRTGRNVSPAWSPDGGRLAFVSSAVAEPNRRFVVVMPAGGGQAREFLIPTTASLNQDLRWFGNGRGLGLSGNDTRGAPAVFRLLLDTGEWNTIPVSDREMPPTSIEWTHDGSAFYCVLYRQGRQGKSVDIGIFERLVDGDAERLVYRSTQPGAIDRLQLSPDRKWLAFRESTYEANTLRPRILIADVGTGETRVLVEPVPGSNEGQELNFLGWTPSGDLLVQKLSGTGGTRSETLIVPVNGGTPRSFAIPRIGPLAPGETLRAVAKWSPDGRTMVLGRDSRGGETFVIENPLAGARAATASR